MPNELAVVKVARRDFAERSQSCFGDFCETKPIDVTIGCGTVRGYGPRPWDNLKGRSKWLRERRKFYAFPPMATPLLNS